MNLPFYIAKRYLKSKSGKSAITIITRIAITGVVVGAMALFIVLSGFSGLRDFTLQFTNIFDSDLKILPASGKTITINPKTIAQLDALEGVANYSKIIEERVFLQYKGRHHIATLKAVDPSYTNVIVADSIITHGEWFSQNTGSSVLGIGASLKLSISTNDFANLLEVIVPKPGTGQINALDPSEAFNMKPLVVSGVYNVNENLDDEYLFTDIDFARGLLNLGTTKVSSIEFKLLPNQDEALTREKLNAIFSEELIIKNRMQQNDALYKMLNSENIFVYFFVSLIAAIAIFNIAGTIIMMILEKKRNIKTLISIGLTIKEVRRVFFYEGILLTAIGTIIGLLLGILLVLAQMLFGFIPITPTLPYPVKFEIKNVLLVLGTILFLGAIASQVASRRITNKLVS